MSFAFWLCVAPGILVAGTVLGVRWWIAGRSRRAARRAAPTTIADFRSGAAGVIVGKVRFVRDALDAPYSGRRVCYYHARLHDEPGLPADAYDLPALIPFCTKRASDFLVEDGTGSALIRAGTCASFEVPPKWISGAAEEGVLEEGDMVAVYGVGEWDRNPARDGAAPFAGYREAPRRVVMRAPEGLHLHIREVR